MSTLTRPCSPCRGYGYFGHTNPSIGDRCHECKGAGMVTERHKYCDNCVTRYDLQLSHSSIGEQS